MRKELLTKLRELGVTQVDCSYSGYGDSGQVESLETTPKVDLSVVVSEQPHPWKPNTMWQQTFDDQLREFFWTTAYEAHPGFENNDGGQGEFIWNIETDKISLEHGTNFMETEHSSHEI